MQQEGFDFGAELRDEGIATAADHAEADCGGWQDMALRFLERYPKGEFMTEEIRDFAYSNGLPLPPHERAWGSVIVKAKKDGLITHAGFRAVRNPAAHKTPASVWRKQ